jgi:hypothetical protein
MNEENKDDAYSIAIGDKIFYFGSSCPPIESMFFPMTIEKEKGEADDSAQST